MTNPSSPSDPHLDVVRERELRADIEELRQSLARVDDAILRGFTKEGIRGRYKAFRDLLRTFDYTLQDALAPGSIESFFGACKDDDGVEPGA